MGIVKFAYGVSNAKMIRCQTRKQCEDWISKMQPRATWQLEHHGVVYQYGRPETSVTMEAGVVRISQRQNITPLYTLGPGPKVDAYITQPSTSAVLPSKRLVGRIITLRLKIPNSTLTRGQPRGYLAVIEVTDENKHHLEPLARKAEKRRQGCRTRPASLS